MQTCTRGEAGRLATRTCLLTCRARNDANLVLWRLALFHTVLHITAWRLSSGRSSSIANYRNTNLSINIAASRIVFPSKARWSSMNLIMLEIYYSEDTNDYHTLYHSRRVFTRLFVRWSLHAPDQKNFVFPVDGNRRAYVPWKNCRDNINCKYLITSWKETKNQIYICMY